MLKCIVVDDEPLAIQLLSDYIEKTEALELVNTFSNPIEALQFIQENLVDLIFLDVQMPELTGIQFMKILNQKYEIILTTAYEQYAIDGFDHNAVDYLLKPISYERFFKAIQKVLDRLKTEEPVNQQVSTPQESYIFVKSEYRVQKVDLNDIYYLEGLGDYVAIHTPNGKILTLENMKQLETRLPDTGFMRVHKSFIISFSKIEYIERNRIIIKDQRIPISDTYKKSFWDKVKK